MNRRHYAVLILLVQLFTKCNLLAEDATEAQWPVLAIGEQGGWKEFVVPLRKLPCRVTWDPTSGAFPLDLSKACFRALETVRAAEHPTNELRVRSITIRRFNPPPAVYSSPAAASNGEWFVRIRVGHLPEETTTRPLSQEHVIMLLDGTIAQALPSFRPTEDAPTRALARSAARPANNPSGSAGDTLDTSALAQNELLRDPSFIPPAIQWNPPMAPFPLDIHAGVSASLSYLSSIASTNSAAFSLQEIEFSRFIPRIQPDGHVEDYDHNRNHWVITFAFTSGLEGIVRRSVGMLLDGRILDKLLSTNASSQRPSADAAQP
jgi:hypothetical protein